MFDPLIPIHPIVTADELKAIRKKYGFRRFLLAEPGLETRIFGVPGIEVFERIADRLNALKDALTDTDIEINWWCAPTIQCGVNSPLQHVVNWDGRESLDALCPFDPEFRKLFSSWVARVAELAHPPIILFEDDFRLKWHSIGIDQGCFCPFHLKALEKATSRSWTREELVKIYQEDHFETQGLRRLFAQISKESLSGLAAAVRAEVDKVAPDTRLAVCESAASDSDGYNSIEEPRIFAGPNTRPLIRVWGSTYSCVNSPLTVLRCLWHTMYTAERLPEDFEWMHESDTYPHNRYFMSASFLETLISGAMAFGADNSQLYALQYLDDPYEETGYLEMAARNAARFQAIGKASRNGRFDGCHLCFDPASDYLKKLSSTSGTEGYVAGYDLLGRLGIPFSTRYGSPAVLFGQIADVLSDEELSGMLKTALLLDAEAVEILERRGFGAMLGVRTERLDEYRFSQEKILDLPEFSHIRGRLIYNYAFKASGTEKADYMRLIPLPGCEVLSYYGNIEDDKLMPGMVRYVNPGGGRIGIIAASVAGNKSSNLYSYRKKEMIRILIEWLRNSPLPAVAANLPNLWVLVKNTPDGSLFYLTNLNADVLEPVTLFIAPEFRPARFEELSDDGAWQTVQTSVENGQLVLPGNIPPLRMRVFRTRK